MEKRKESNSDEIIAMNTVDEADGVESTRVINDEFVQDLDWAMFNAMLARADQLEEVSMLAAQKLPWTKQMQSAVQSKLSAGAQKLLQFGTFAMA